MHVQLLLSAGAPPIRTVGDPGVHGAAVIGVQVPGVSTPSAADVCDAVMGLSRLMHTPNGAMLANGLESLMLAIGWFSAITLPTGNTVSVDGAAPIEHIIIAPFTTGRPTPKL